MNIKVTKYCCRGDEGEACPTCGGAVFEAEKVIYNYDDEDDDDEVDDDVDNDDDDAAKVIHFSSVFLKSTFERIRIVGCYKDLNYMVLLCIVYLKCYAVFNMINMQVTKKVVDKKISCLSLAKIFLGSEIVI